MSPLELQYVKMILNCSSPPDDEFGSIGNKATYILADILLNGRTTEKQRNWAIEFALKYERK